MNKRAEESQRGLLEVVGLRAAAWGLLAVVLSRGVLASPPYAFERPAFLNDPLESKSVPVDLDPSRRYVTSTPPTSV